MDNSQKPVEDLINTGLAEAFYRVCGVPLLFYNGPDVKKVTEQMLKKYQNRSLYAVAKTSTFSVSENSYKPNTLLRRGLHSRSSHDHVLTYELNLIPVTTTYDISVYIQDFPSVKSLSKAWMFAAVRNGLNFSIGYGVADLDINVKMDKNLTIPGREGGATEVKEYLLNTSFSVSGYMSEPLKITQAVTDLEVTIRTLEELGLGGGSVTLFTKDWLHESRPTETGSGGSNLPPVDVTFIHDQLIPSSVWVVNHDLNKFPSVTIIDADGNVVEATVNFLSTNIVVVTFGLLTTGRAFIN